MLDQISALSYSSLEIFASLVVDDEHLSDDAKQMMCGEIIETYLRNKEHRVRHLAEYSNTLMHSHALLKDSSPKFSYLVGQFSNLCRSLLLTAFKSKSDSELSGLKAMLSMSGLISEKSDFNEIVETSKSRYFVPC